MHQERSLPGNALIFLTPHKISNRPTPVFSILKGLCSKKVWESVRSMVSERGGSSQSGGFGLTPSTTRLLHIAALPVLRTFPLVFLPVNPFLFAHTKKILSPLKSLEPPKPQKKPATHCGVAGFYIFL